MRAMMRAALWILALGVVVFSWACGGESKPQAKTQQFATGYSKDIKKQLDYDAHVVSSEEDGDKLIVNVNDTWKPSPPGIKAQLLADWFDKWKAAHGDAKGLEVVVRADGEDVDRYAADGYHPVEKKKKGE
ncbi:MAG TPA: hypothetical protein VNN73_09520 [Blastocatellia bacterium]|nr:hypothetical protein [Blastocatellia bacterium]